MPRIAPGEVEFKIKSAKIEAAKTEGKQNLNLQLETIKDTNSTGGDKVPAGAVVFHTVSLTPTAAYPASRVAGAVASICQSARKNITLKSVLDNAQQMEGWLVTAKVGIQSETEAYAERNTIKGFVIKK